MTLCDLCRDNRECLQIDIDGREYDICAKCWNPLAKKLKGKGRVKSQEVVLLPPPVVRETEENEPGPLPGEPPKIWGGANKPN